MGKSGCQREEEDRTGGECLGHRQAESFRNRYGEEEAGYKVCCGVQARRVRTTLHVSKVRTQGMKKQVCRV